MNILYGGSFNPPTKAHLEIVENLIKKYENSTVIILPVGDSYYKKELISFNYRYEMLEMMFKDNKNVVISNLENTNKFLGTLDSLNRLSESYDNLHLVIGSDNIYNFDNWINFDLILKKYSLLIFRRNFDNVELLMEKYKNYNPKFEVIDFSNTTNSTAIRSNINEHKNMITNDIYEYIIKNKLYEVK